MRGRLWCGLVCLLLAGADGQAADSTVVTLSCDGTITDQSAKYDPRPIGPLRIVVDLAAKTVTFDGRLFSIDVVNADTVGFGSGRLAGIIERTTGKTDVQDGTTGTDFWYYLDCKVPTRV